MLRIGLTGGIGSGKSTVADRFTALGVPVVDADLIAREVVAPGEPALAEVVRAFGEGVLNAQGELDRRRMRAAIFTDPAARARLEAILHPAILGRVEQHLARLRAPYAILAIPLLIESDWTQHVDRVLVVDVPEELQVARTLARDGTSAQEVHAILDAQASRAERLALADDVLLNTGDLAALQQQVNALHQRYLALAEARP